MGSGDQRVGKWLDKWLEDHVKENNSPRTHQSYESHVRVWLKPTIGNIRLDKLKAADIRRMLNNNEKKRSAATALHVFTTLKIGLNCAVKIEELITQNVILQVASPKPKQISQTCLMKKN